MVLVFKTSVKLKEQAETVEKSLSKYAGLMVNFDLEDCDNILRVEGNHCSSVKIITELQDLGFDCVELM